MPRPKKATVDYFPHFVASGKTMFTLESRWGNDGYAFWFKLLEMLGASEQHYIDCEDTAEWEFLLAKTRLGAETANDILTMLAKLDAIDRDLWQYKIIRSAHFIENLAALYKRREVNVINNSAVRDLCIQKRKMNGINVNNNSETEIGKNEVDAQTTALKSENIEVSANNNPHEGSLCIQKPHLNGISANKNPQSKAKKSRYNNNKLLLTPSENLPDEQETPSAADADAPLADPDAYIEEHKKRKTKALVPKIDNPETQLYHKILQSFEAVLANLRIMPKRAQRLNESSSYPRGTSR
jgi:hypothetical protein